LPPEQRQHAIEKHEHTNWDRARLSVVVPIGVIVVVAIVCIVVAVLSSARRADEGALIHERQLLTGALRRGEHRHHDANDRDGDDHADRDHHAQAGAIPIGGCVFLGGTLAKRGRQSEVP
jgi:hypothetical protein